MYAGLVIIRFRHTLDLAYLILANFGHITDIHSAETAVVYLIDHILDRMDRQMTTGAMQLLRGPLRDYIFLFNLREPRLLALI